MLLPALFPSFASHSLNHVLTLFYFPSQPQSTPSHTRCVTRQRTNFVLPTSSHVDELDSFRELRRPNPVPGYISPLQGCLTQTRKTLIFFKTQPTPHHRPPPRVLFPSFSTRDSRPSPAPGPESKTIVQNDRLNHHHHHTTATTAGRRRRQGKRALPARGH